jgi:LPXTG-site transpeptidase (sortase) family protein
MERGIGVRESNDEGVAGSKDRAVRRRLAFVLTVGGVVLLLYVSGQYWQTYAAQTRLAQEWQRQSARPANISTSDNDLLVRLTIAKIDLDAVVVEGTSHQLLKLGPGHLEGSAVPGKSGNSVIVAHRDTFFRHLDELKEGDEIDLRRQSEVYRFEVVGRRIVAPTEVSVLQPSLSTQLTLITCYPTHYVGPAPNRLVVVARLMLPSETSPR